MQVISESICAFLLSRSADSPILMHEEKYGKTAPQLREKYSVHKRAYKVLSHNFDFMSHILRGQPIILIIMLPASLVERSCVVDRHSHVEL